MGRESNGKSRMPFLHIRLGGEKGSRKDKGGQGPRDQVPAPLFLLAHQTNSQRLATLWSIPPTQALFSTHLSKQPLIKQNEQRWVGGVPGQRAQENWPGWLWWLSLS